MINNEEKNQDAKQVKSASDKVFEKSGKKLDDEFLKNISGGSTMGVHYVAGAMSIGTTLSALGTSIAACVYASKASKAKLSGNDTDYDRYIKKTKNCGIATASLIGAAAVSGVVSGATPSLSDNVVLSSEKIKTVFSVVLEQQRFKRGNDFKYSNDN